MSKGIKILLGLVSTIILLLIFLPLAASLALTVPSVQNRIVRWGSDWATEFMGTTVTFDRVGIRFPNKITVDGFYVEDYGHDTLIYSGSLTAPIRRLRMSPFELDFGTVRLRDTQFDLRADSLDSLNIKLLVNRIKAAQNPNKPKSSFKISFRGIEGTGIKYGQYLNIKRVESPIDYSHMVLYVDSLSIGRFDIVGDSINMRINRLKFTERCGFKVNRLSATDLTVCSGRVLLDGVHIVTDDSHLVMPRIYLIGKNWGTYKHYVDSVRMNIISTGSVLTAHTLSYFTDVFKGKDLTLRALSFETDRPLVDFQGRITSADLNGNSLAADFKTKGMPDMPNTQWNINLKRLNTTARAADKVMHEVSGKSLPQTVMAMLEREGTLTVCGHFDGLFSRFKADADVAALSGKVALTADMRQDGVGHIVNYAAHTADFGLGRLLGIPKIGNISFDALLNGTLTDGSLNGGYSLAVPRVGLLGYDYSGLDVRGDIQGKRISGKAECTDKNLRMVLDAVTDFEGDMPRYDGHLALKHADLAKIGLNRRDTLSVLSADADLEVSGNGLDDMYGRLDIADVNYVYNADSLHGQSLVLQGHNNETSKYLHLSSDFADAEYRSRLSYQTIIAYLGRFMESYLPIIKNSTKAKLHIGEQIAEDDVNDYSLLTVNFKKSNEVAQAIIDGLQIADGTTLRFMFNPTSDLFSLTAQSDYIEYNDMFASRLRVNAGNKGDSLTMYVNAEDMYVKTLYMPNLSIQGGAKNHNVSLSARFNNKEEEYSAMLGLRTRMRYAADGTPQVGIHITPSHITRKGKTWYITSGGIIYDTTRITVRNFIVSSPSLTTHGDRIDSLRVWGVASRSNADTLHVSLSNVDLSPLLSLAESVGYNIAATADGHVDCISALGGGRLDGRIDIDNMTVGDVKVAPLRFLSTWDIGRQRVVMNLLNRHDGHNIMEGFFNPADRRFTADLNADSLNVALLDPVLSGVLKNTNGQAKAKLNVAGTLGNEKSVKINGLVSVPRFETTIGYTNVTYALSQAYLEFNNNVLALRPNYATDAEGHRCRIGLSVDLNRLKNIKYNIDLKPENIMVLNTTRHDNEAFYGRIYATGTANIKGDNMGSSMTASATPTNNSIFYYPLNSTVEASRASFVVFRDPKMQKIDSTDYLLSKKLSYERKRKRMESTSAPFKLGLNINLTPAAEFELIIDPSMGGDIQGRGEGNLAINVDTGSGEFTMFGACTITEGVYNFAMRNLFADKKFNIVPGGTITWTGAPDDALLSLEATYKLKASLAPLSVASNDNLRGNVPVECLIKLAGELLQPTITFDVKVPNADTEIQNLVSNAMNTQEMTATQFFCLLAFGSFYSESSSLGQSLSVGAVGSATGFEFLSNQISSWLSNDQYNIILRYIPKNEMTGDEFDFGFSKGLINDRLLIEIEGNYVSDRATTGANNNASNLAGDFFLTWLLNRSGNLKLKGFSQTITRFDENQGLQESGVGLYYKKDFNSLKDIFAKKRGKNSKFAVDDADDTDTGADQIDADSEDLMYDVDTRD